MIKLFIKFVNVLIFGLFSFSPRMADGNVSFNTLRERIDKRLNELEKGIYKFISPEEVENIQFNTKNAIEAPENNSE